MGGLRRSGARAHALVRDGVVADALAVEVLPKSSCDCHVRLPGRWRGRRIGCHRDMPRRLGGHASARTLLPHGTSRPAAPRRHVMRWCPDSRCRRRRAVEPAEHVQTAILGVRLSGRMMEATGSACSLPSITRRWITTYLSRRARQTARRDPSLAVTRTGFEPTHDHRPSPSPAPLTKMPLPWRVGRGRRAIRNAEIDEAFAHGVHDPDSAPDMRLKRHAGIAAPESFNAPGKIVTVRA